MDKTLASAPKNYLRRDLRKKNHAGYVNWETCVWVNFDDVKTFADAELQIKLWNEASQKSGADWEFDLPLHCEQCLEECSETYVGELCYSCYHKTTMTKKSNSNKTAVDNWKPAKPILVRKEGDIWKFSKSNTPMWTDQWGYQGSSKTPYIISHRTENLNGAMTGEGWACSCPNFTRHTPRTDCKHILNVKLKEGLGVPKAQTKLANVAEKTLKEFEQWQREKAARKAGPATAGDAKLNLFGSTGRKFR